MTTSKEYFKQFGYGYITNKDGSDCLPEHFSDEFYIGTFRVSDSVNVDVFSNFPESDISGMSIRQFYQKEATEVVRKLGDCIDDLLLNKQLIASANDYYIEDGSFNYMPNQDTLCWYAKANSDSSLSIALTKN